MSASHQQSSCNFPKPFRTPLSTEGWWNLTGPRPRSGGRAQTQLPLPESENGVVGSGM
jgi:hypothetical protein